MVREEEAAPSPAPAARNKVPAQNSPVARCQARADKVARVRLDLYPQAPCRPVVRAAPGTVIMEVVVELVGLRR